MGKRTKSSPMGSLDHPFNPLSVVLGASATFVARSYDVDAKHLSATLQAAAPRMLSGDFSPGGTGDISYKEQELETEFAKALGVPMFMAAASQQVYQMARAAGLNKKDGSSLIMLYEEMVGVKLGPRGD